MANKQDIRQSNLHASLPLSGYVSGANLDTYFAPADAAVQKLFEDRNALLSDGGTITFTGTQVQFTDNLKLSINQNAAGAVPYVISLGSSSQNFVSSGDMLVAVVNRTAATATLSIITNGNPIPAPTSSNLDTFLIAIRRDASDGTQRLYFRDGSAFTAGQSARLGAAGSGGTGSGIGDDLDSLQFQASFSDLFTESASSSNSSVNATSPNTNATFNAAKAMYAISYDASKTVTTSGTAATVSSAPAYTVAAGDVVVSGGYARKITAVASQTSYTLEAAFPSNLSAASACISQAVITKDIYNLSVDGVALQTEFGTTTFSEIMVDYKDNATSGSNTFTPNVTPQVSFVASPDNTNFTTVQTRPSATTTTVPSTLLSSAGTSLYLRFFSSASSGSGTVNLITYKAFMQKSVTAAGTNNVLWSTFGMTNNSTTPLNCTISVVGGKTTIKVTNNTYPVGSLSGQTVGALTVLVNGSVIDRFVSGSTPTTDAYYTEVDQRTIQLDRDYSSLSYSVSLVYSLQVIDSSTTNTTAISAIQEVNTNGFQAFVNQATVIGATSTTGSPTSGSFYSSITNRASIPDLTQDLLPRLGVQRFMTQSIQKLQTEFGPSGQPVWAVPNDTYGQARFVGGWAYTSDANGSRPYTGSNTDYVEMTFYGTGLNILSRGDGSARTYTPMVDGVTATAVSQTQSGILSGRNYAPDVVIPLVTGLSLGVHTVTVTMTTGSQLDFYGFEVINQYASGSSLVTVNPGIAYQSGQKLVLASQSTLAYSAPVVGTTGGRVVEYITTTGTRGQAFTQNASSPSYLSAASHTNEEVARTFFFREFGANRSDDFSTLASGRTAAFALDDGTTSLITTGAGAGTPINGVDTLQWSAVNQSITFVFVGTGLDVEISTSSIVGTYTSAIDGGTATAISLNSSGVYTYKLASGLPYGTHVCVLKLTAYTSGSAGIVKYVTYQPKTPSIPSGAVQVGSYNVLATYVNNTTSSIANISTGVLRKNLSQREAAITGTWNTVSVDPVNFCSGVNTSSSTSGATFSYTFFGTGFDYRFPNNSNAVSMTLTIAVDGSTNLSGYTTSSHLTSGMTFTPSTGVITGSNGTTQPGMGVSVSGLTLGLHTVTFTSSASGYVYPDCLDIITPIHSVKSNLYADSQNALPVGSMAISDDRQTTLIKNALPAVKASAQATGIASSPTTTSTSAVPCPDMSVTIKTGGGPLQIAYTVASSNNTAGGHTYFYIYVDGVYLNLGGADTASSANYVTTVSGVTQVPMAAGYHKVDLYWSVGSGTTATLDGGLRTLTVSEK